MFRVKDKLEKIKWFFQRGKNGFCDCDTDNIDYWFLKTMPKLLQRYIEINNEIKTHPSFCSYDEWVDIIDEMIYCFKEADEDTCSMKNEYDYVFDKYSFIDEKTQKMAEIPSEEGDKWINREHEIDVYRDKMLLKGLDLFKEYFKDLWW